MLQSKYQQIWKTQQRPQGWKTSVYFPIPTKGNAKECSNYHTIVYISHACKEMLKILQARLQQYVNQELPDVQAGFRKGRGSRGQTANIHWIIEKSREVQKKTSIFASLTMIKVWPCGSQVTAENSSRDNNTRQPYLPPEKPVWRSRSNRTRHEMMDWLQIWKEVCQSCIFSSCLFNLYAKYIMRNARLNEHKLESKLPGEISINLNM